MRRSECYIVSGEWWMAIRISSIPYRRYRNEAERIAYLRTVRSFATLPETALRRAAAASRVRRVERGEFIFLEGQTVDALSILVEGRVKVVRETDDGQEVILRQIVPGDVFGMLGSWNEPLNRASAMAQTDATLIQLPQPEFFSLLESHPSFTLAILHEFRRRLQDAEARISDLQTKQAACRVAAALLRVVSKMGFERSSGSEITVRLSRQDVAELSGTNLCTASRLLSDWDHRGIVVAGREQVRIRQPGVLAAIAEGVEGVGDRALT
jgi:CRP/FNR family transcriptional regulator, nitrogen oxide reductase regulator